MLKATPEEIRRRFDADVERFSVLETGQSATMDAPLVLELIAASASAVNPKAKSLLDIGCGAGNYSVKLLQRLPGMEVTLLDLSKPMLDRAAQRVAAAGAGHVTTIQADVREVELPREGFDIITAAAVLHHLRTDAEWEAVFAKLFASLRLGGSIWISDLIFQAHPGVHEVIWRRYGDYLAGMKDLAYRDQVFAYIEKEDTPRTLEYQLELLRRAGFAQIDVLHKNGPFAAFGAVKGTVRGFF